MTYSLEEFYPPKPFFIIDGRKFLLNIVRMRDEVTIRETYGSLENIFEVIREDPTSILDIVWILLSSKKGFDSKDDFKSFCLGSTDLLQEWSKFMMEALNKSVYLSMPLIKNHKRMKDLQNIKGGESSRPCYVTYYDSVASRYGYTIERFYDLTLRQLHLILKIMNDKKYEELEVSASLHGRKLNPRVIVNDITEDEEKEQDDQASAALNDLKERYKKANKEKS